MSKNFLPASFILQIVGVCAIIVLIIEPQWYYGLRTKDYVLVYSSITVLIAGQVIAAKIWSKKNNTSFLVGISSIAIPMIFLFLAISI
jgi:hypothetical protein